MCRMTETGNVAQLCTYARIDTVDVPFTGDLMDAWEDPSSFFLLSSEHHFHKHWRGCAVKCT